MQERDIFDFKLIKRSDGHHSEMIDLKAQKKYRRVKSVYNADVSLCPLPHSIFVCERRKRTRRKCRQTNVAKQMFQPTTMIPAILGTVGCTTSVGGEICNVGFESIMGFSHDQCNVVGEGEQRKL